MKNNQNDQVTPAETEAILKVASECLTCDGDFVELGCYRGDTSVLLGKMLVENKTDKKLCIYDSFAGLPEKSSEDNSGAGQNFQGGELKVSKREVVDKIRRAGLKNVIIKKAWFDELADDGLPSKIAFAFLDGDLYGSIKTSFELVLPRMAENGIIIVHDYNNPELPGASRAVDEFCRTYPEKRLKIQHSLAIIY